MAPAPCATKTWSTFLTCCNGRMSPKSVWPPNVPPPPPHPTSTDLISMEPIQHAHHTPRKKNSAKVNFTISIVIHAVLFALGAYWAAHEGVLGKKLQELSVGLLPKEKSLSLK